MKERVVKFDVLRCMLMLMVTTIHFISHGMKFASVDSGFCFHLNEPIGCLNFCIAQNVHLFVVIAVNCFVFMTGYFMIESTILRLDKLVRLWLQVLFYSLGISVVVYFVSGDIPLSSILKSAIPIKSNAYWFMTNYFALSLLAPFVSKVAKELTRQQYLILLGIMMFLTTEMYKFPYGYTYGNIWGTSLLFFILLFLVGGYFKKHGFLFSKFRGGIFCCWLICLFVAISYSNISVVNGSLYALVGAPPYHSWTFITSILFFNWFIGLKSRNNCFTNVLSRIAPYTLAVYLIQEHPLIQARLWRVWIVLDGANINSMFFILMYITIPVGVFMISVLMDFFRIKLFRLSGKSIGIYQVRI